MALPEDVQPRGVRHAGYEQSVSNLSRVSLESDNVFSDGYDLQIPKVSGDVSKGYQLTFTCAI